MLSLGSDGITWVFDWIAWDCSKFRGFWLSFITVSLAIFINNNYNISSNLQREEQLNSGYIAMKINPSKTKELRVCFSFQSPYAPITVSDRVMLLGVVISSDLKWNSHIDYVYKKAAKRLYGLRLLKRNSLPADVLLSLYCTYIRPIV